MKINNILGLLLLSLFSLNFAACSEDKDPIEESEISDLILKSETVKVVVGTTAEIEISKGNGDYKAFSLNPEIATVKMDNGKIIVEGKNSGITSIVLSDKSNQFKKVSIVSYYDQIILSQETVDVKMPIGNPKIKTIEVLSGNGGYTTSVDKEDLVLVTVNKNVLSIKALKEGTAVITIKDALDLVKEITVNITTTDVAYDNEDLEGIKANETLRYDFAGSTTINSENRWYTYLNKKENDLNLCGWDYYNYYFLKLYFAGDKSVGEKTNGKLTYKYNSLAFTDEPIKFEIIKNDGTKIWAIYSFIKDGKLYFGHFCQNID